MRRQQPEGRGETTTWHGDDELRHAEEEKRKGDEWPGQSERKIFPGHDPAALPGGLPQEPPSFGVAKDTAAPDEAAAAAGSPEEADELSTAATTWPTPAGKYQLGSEWSWSSDDELAAELRVDDSQSEPEPPADGWGIPVGADPATFAKEPDPGGLPQAFSRTRAAEDLYARVMARRRERERLGLRVARFGRSSHALQLASSKAAADAGPARAGSGARAELSVPPAVDRGRQNPAGGRKRADRATVPAGGRTA
jgi:hypothetical protein